MTLEAWLLFVAADAALSLTPGPAVLLVVSLAVARGAGVGVRASLGILTANAMYFTISATGLGTLLLASYNVFFAVKWLGALYLVWIGTGMILGAREARDPAATRPAPTGAGFRHGFLMNAANPKLLVYFVAILPQFIDPAGPLALQVGILGLTSMGIELVVLVGYARLAARSRQLVRTPRSLRWLQRAGGALLVVIGARVAALRRVDPAAVLP